MTMFEAAGAGACSITDTWVGLERFLVLEVLVVRDGEVVATDVVELTPAAAKTRR